MKKVNSWVYTDDGKIIIAPCLPEVIVERVNDEAIIPAYAYDGDSGMDVYATEDVFVQPGKTKQMGLGFKLGIPKHPLHDFGYRWEAQVRPRSGLASKTMLRVANAPGTVDNAYRGEVGVLITNTKQKTEMVGYAINIKGEGCMDLGMEFPMGTYLIKKGERFAQIVFNEVIRPMKLTEGKVDDTDRGTGGFGSTGV